MGWCIFHVFFYFDNITQYACFVKHSRTMKCQKTSLLSILIYFRIRLTVRCCAGHCCISPTFHCQFNAVALPFLHSYSPPLLPRMPACTAVWPPTRPAPRPAASNWPWRGRRTSWSGRPRTQVRVNIPLEFRASPRCCSEDLSMHAPEKCGTL